MDAAACSSLRIALCPIHAIGTAQYVSARGVKKGCSTVTAHSGLIRPSRAEAQPHGGNVFNFCQHGPRHKRVLPQPIVAALWVRNFPQTLDIWPPIGAPQRLGERLCDSPVDNVGVPPL